MVDRPQQVASDSEKILNDSVHRPESLHLTNGFEPAHLSLPLSDRLMGDFSSIVSVAFGVMHDRRHHRAARCLIGSHCVVDRPPLSLSLIFHKQKKNPPPPPLTGRRMNEHIDPAATVVAAPP